MRSGESRQPASYGLPCRHPTHRHVARSCRAARHALVGASSPYISCGGALVSAVSAPPTDVTRLLLDVSHGDANAHEALLSAVYDDLRAAAARQVRRERDGHTLSATALVHEAYLRLVDGTMVAYADRTHFYAVAAQAMRRVLVDWARARGAAKRGGRQQPVSLDALSEAGIALPAEDRAEALLALDEALARLEALDPRKARVVECRYMAGLTLEETAAALGVSPTTVKTDWALARAWLHRELAASPSPSV